MKTLKFPLITPELQRNAIASWCKGHKVTKIGGCPMPKTGRSLRTVREAYTRNV